MIPSMMAVGTLAKIAESCPAIQRFSISTSVMGQFLVLTLSDIEALLSLSHLRYLDINTCQLNLDLVKVLARFKHLEHLRIDSCHFDLTTIFRAIGSKLVGLDLAGVTGDTIDGIVEHCPNLEELAISQRSLEDEEDDDYDEEYQEEYYEERRVREGQKRGNAIVGDYVKKGFNKLSKLEVNGDSIRLGTD
jgi:hypothetical protein